ncbi:ATP-binding protein [Lachnospiraceae bacterium CLA-AA-H215]|uniref:ATP-binding protein n=1 Tax=Hominifimenecus microfluidus TaxID=2885348 RepID=A0AAE3ECA3_9FIRM|nr:AAA family ATPase [Hominifimenecus microfluidus]MCC2232412.1 ATP-binding protein [Hominifimenecus microfluidus]
MATALKLPVGIEDFKEIRRQGFYYIDKTKLIEQLLDNWGKVNLFTRPRRFGKTLNMSMLRCFFEIGADKTLFEGLYISQNEQFCEEYMGRFPVVFLTLKGVEGTTFEEARLSLAELIAAEARRFKFLQESDSLDADDKEMYRELISLNKEQSPVTSVKLRFSLKNLLELLYKHYGRKTIVLIDEYDVPLDKAFQDGYYREMVSLIRGLLGETLKTNDFLQFAVLTGCLRVSKENIFTGLNNFKILSITDVRFDEQFGFTEDEVKKLLNAYHLESHLPEMKEWYDGYHFGDANIYCPWDVINHVELLCKDSKAEPKCYWINSSGNSLVKRFITKANKTTRDEIERLIAGEPIEKSVRLELTYDEIDNSIDNIWSVLFTTGYLTQVGMTEQGAYKLVIPNKEVREVYKLQIQDWFDKKLRDNTEQLTAFWNSIEEGKTEAIEQYLNRTLSNSISVFDTKAPEKEKESSYHTLLVGLLTGNTDWVVRSNVEAGEGFADIIVEPEDPDAGIIFELKYSKEANGLQISCEKAIEQIKSRRYSEYLKNDGRHNMTFYGIAFYKKRCKAVVETIKET